MTQGVKLGDGPDRAALDCYEISICDCRCLSSLLDSVWACWLQSEKDDSRAWCTCTSSCHPSLQSCHPPQQCSASLSESRLCRCAAWHSLTPGALQ